LAGSLTGFPFGLLLLLFLLLLRSQGLLLCFDCSSGCCGSGMCSGGSYACEC
jgi:hypothetical protein